MESTLQAPSTQKRPVLYTCLAAEPSRWAPLGFPGWENPASAPRSHSGVPALLCNPSLVTISQPQTFHSQKRLCEFLNVARGLQTFPPLLPGAPAFVPCAPTTNTVPQLLPPYRQTAQTTDACKSSGGPPGREWGQKSESLWVRQWPLALSGSLNALFMLKIFTFVEMMEG